MNIQDLISEIQSQKESIKYLRDHPNVAKNTVMRETPEYCRGALAMLRYLTEYANMQITSDEVPLSMLSCVEKYDVEYKGVKCIGVDWETKLFLFEYDGEVHIWFQTADVDCTADTDHIRCVIEDQFLPMKGRSGYVKGDH